MLSELLGLRLIRRGVDVLPETVAELGDVVQFRQQLDRLVKVLDVELGRVLEDADGLDVDVVFGQMRAELTKSGRAVFQDDVDFGDSFHYAPRL